ncbi:hypothetical protein [Actinomadura rugatobispora]|uniref:Uncharacterized protein n=1 Tax=Actinomadura rugatobispora TaxID=1994 RepID=A0ABW1A5T3_9ACTN|nr:hypothetical protein GCM10010200_074530 [Actinomadura rugatobispora]
MQPTTAAPPVPTGRAALDAWRELDRGLRRDLLRGDRAHPDPTTAVIAVGYARAMLGVPYWRRAWPVLVAVVVWAVAVVIVTEIAAPGVSFGWGSPAGPAAAVPAVAAVLLAMLRLRRRSLAWHRLESLHAAALWVTEQPAPYAGTPGAQEMAVRYDRAVLRRQYFLLVAIAAFAVAAASAWNPAVGLGIAAIFGVLVTLTVVLTMRSTRPHLPALHLRADGFEVPALEARVAWSELGEIRVVPYRAPAGGLGAKGRNRVVVFVAADAGTLIARLRPRAARRARTCMKAYGGPLAFADVALERSAEEIAAAASALSGLPVRRFGP